MRDKIVETFEAGADQRSDREVRRGAEVHVELDATRGSARGVGEAEELIGAPGSGHRRTSASGQSETDDCGCTYAFGEARLDV